MEYKNTLDPGFSQKLSIAIKRFVVIEPAGSVRNKVLMCVCYNY